MSQPSLNTLKKIALYTGLGGITAMVIISLKAQDKVSESPYFREAFKVLRAHEGAKQLLGEPIKQQGFKASDKNNFCDGEKAHFSARVKGPNDKGRVYFWATLVDKKWIIDREELEVNKEPHRRLLIVGGTESTESQSKVEFDS